MKRSFLLRLAPCSAVLVALATAGTTFAYGGETIVNSQIVSDTAAPADSYVGDMSPEDAGVACNCDGVNANGSGGAGYERQYSQPDLFYNYYVGPAPSGTAAQLYESPLPTPPFVGHTWVTYQPFMPHEYLWRHNRSYYTYNPGAGWTRTNVRYGTGCCGCCNKASRMFDFSPYLGTFNGLYYGFIR